MTYQDDSSGYWVVVRRDKCGNEYLVDESVTKQRAERVLKQLESRLPDNHYLMKYETTEGNH